MQDNGTAVIPLIGKLKEYSLHEHTGQSMHNEMPASDELKINMISDHFRQIMRIMGFDLNEEDLKDTPDRAAKMMVKEIFNGLHPEAKPVLICQDNKYQYREMILEKNIPLYTTSEHYFSPVTGKIHIAYLPGKKTIGLTGLNQVIQYHSRRLQVMERLIEEIAVALKECLETRDVAIMIDSVHLCVPPGKQDDRYNSKVISHYSGKFKNEVMKQEFLSCLK